jgi:hypothetical protein
VQASGKKEAILQEMQLMSRIKILKWIVRHAIAYTMKTANALQTISELAAAEPANAAKQNV